MHSLRFGRPVVVSVDFDGRVSIRSLMDVHRFLTDWPPSRRTSVYATAQRACQAAREGHLTADQARRAFIEFARVHDILWLDTNEVNNERAIDLRPFTSDI